MDKGFIKLSRNFFSHSMWEAARTFSESEAWLDLIQSARFDTTETIERIGGRDIKWGRGQYPASNRFLAKKWGWGEQKVKNFLGKLKTEKMITSDKSQGMNVLTLCKYDEFNSKNPTCNPENNPDISLVLKELQELKTQLATQKTTQQEPSRNPNNKKDNKENNTKKESPNGDKKETDVSSLNPDFLKFNDWIKRKAPFCSNPKNFPSQITEDEFLKLKGSYTGQQIADIVEQIENRKDLRKRYVNLYRTVLNWAKKEYGNNSKEQQNPITYD